ncbi:MAG: Sll0314/Alr1548 family TPR repeat-containing protein [Elainellaceae cyanobacterium]
MLLSTQKSAFKPNRRIKQFASATLGTMAIALSMWVNPAFADPFRTTNTREFDSQTEAAFDAMFVQGNYRAAERHLQAAASDEPMIHAMKASLAYLDEDWEALSENARLTLESADRLIADDPLRGYLYTAIGHFMEGAYVLSTQGTVRATPTVLSKLRQVFDNLGQAESIDSTDAELNLIKGYMDLMLAVNLPFSSPDQAIERLQSYGAPVYLVNRGVAIAYRDLRQEDKALEYVDKALQETPDNPDLYYLKAQILRLQGNLEESEQFFQQALRKQSQLPDSLAEQVAYEFCRTRDEIRGQDRDCHRWARQRIQVGEAENETDDVNEQSYRIPSN